MAYFRVSVDNTSVRYILTVAKDEADAREIAGMLGAKVGEVEEITVEEFLGK